jgi:predicted aspartyl protease
MLRHRSTTSLFQVRPIAYLMASLTIGGVGLVAFPSRAQTANRSTSNPCFMVTSSGQQLNLGQLCGEANTPAPNIRPRTFRVKIKRRLASTPVIDVNFNGRSFEMILDTGASTTLITQDMANALKIQPTGYREVIVADGSTLKFPVSAVKSVSAGGLTAKNLEVTIADKADVGLLGHDFFGNYDVKIKRGVIEFSPPTGE